jgi:hypothetical protein
MLTELKAILKMSAQEGQRDAANKTSVELTTQYDDFQEVKGRKRNISNNTSRTAKRLANPLKTVTVLNSSQLPGRGHLIRFIGKCNI